MADKGCLVRFVMQMRAQLLFQVQERGTPLQMEIYVIYTKRHLRAAFRQKGRGQRVPPVSAVS